MMSFPRPPPPPLPPSYHPPLHHSPHDAERKFASWDTLPRPQYSMMTSPSTAHLGVTAGILDPESDSSDVSDTGEEYRPRSQPILPMGLPPPISKAALESQDAIQSRLRDLGRVEDSNIRKSETLKAKRARKDEKIRQKREAQDARIKAIMDARARRDERILRRRRIEDEAFERVDQELEEEENNLRRRMKRLKRGLPLDDIMNHDRGYSPASMSPPGPHYNNMPPAKRRRSGPPGQNDSPLISASRPLTNTNSATNPPHGSSHVPPYSFMHANHPPPPPPPAMTSSMSAPSIYSQSPAYAPPQSSSHMPHVHPPPPPPPQPSSHVVYGAPDPPPSVNGHQSSPHSSFNGSLPPVPPNPTSAPNSAPPQRSSLSSYDTRPPPSSSTGFAPINQTPSTGFAAINARGTGTPPTSTSTPTREPPSAMASRAAEYDRIYGLNRQSTDSTPASAASTTPVMAGKRAPSTTHPYQMSEAFANRHHHCERTDKLSRGIWTYHGPGGTADKPTEPPREMYLRCNHGDCRRIDWRTVHGLQCHIVKNHEQPKGTIGSLEKALERYGVPVSEIEAHERVHGEGSGGVMADVKSFKLKQKAREPSDRVDTKKWIESSAAGTTYRDNIAMSLGGSSLPSAPRQVEQPTETGVHQSFTDSESKTPSDQGIVKPDRPHGGFAAVNGAWGIGKPSESASEDLEMKDAPALPDAAHEQRPAETLADHKVWHLQPPGSTPSSPAPSKQAASSIVPISQEQQPSTATDTGNQQLPSVPGPTSSQGDNIAANDVSGHGDETSEQKVAQSDARSPDGDLSTTRERADNNVIEVKPLQQESPNAEAEIPQEQPKTVESATAIEIDTQTPHSKDGAGADDDKTSAVTSPEGSVRRISMSARRGSARRSSLIASRTTEKDKESQNALNPENEADAAADPTFESIKVETEKDKKAIEADEEEQGDSITVATTPGLTARERKDRDRDDPNTATTRTSKRQSSRQVGKKR